MSFSAKPHEFLKLEYFLYKLLSCRTREKTAKGLLSETRVFWHKATEPPAKPEGLKFF